MAPTKNKKSNVKFVKKSNSQRAAAQASKQRVAPGKPATGVSKKRSSTSGAASSEQPTSGPEEAKDLDNTTLGPLNSARGRTGVSQTSDGSSSAPRRKWADVVLGPSEPTLPSHRHFVIGNAVVGDKTYPISMGDDLDNLDAMSHFDSPIPTVGGSPYSPDKILAEADNILARTIELGAESAIESPKPSVYYHNGSPYFRKVASPTPSFKSVEVRSKSASPIRLVSSPKNTSIMEEHFRKAFSYPPPDVIHPAQAIGRSSEDPPIRSIDDGIIPVPDRHTNVDDSEDPGSLVDMAAGGISTRIRSPTPTTNDNSGVHKFLGETSDSITGFSAVNSISNPSFGVTSPSAISTAAQNVGYQFPVSSGISTLESAHIPPVAIYGHGFPGSKAPNTPPTTRSVVSPVSMVKKLAGEYSASITGPKFGHSMFSETAQKIVADTPLTQTEHSSPTLLPWPNHDAQVQGEMNAITAGPNTTIPSVQTGPATNTHTPTPNLTASQNAEVEMEDRIIIKQEWPTLQDAMKSFLSPQPPSGRLGSLQPENETVARDFYGTAQKSTTAQIQTYAATPPRSIDPGFIESGSQISTDISLPAPTITTSVSSGSAQNDAAAEIAEQSARFSSPLSDLSEKDMKFEDIDDSQTIQVATVTTTPRSTRKATQQVKGTRGRRNSAPGMTKTNTLSSGPVGSLTTTQSDTIPIDIDTEDAGRTAARSISNDQFGIFRAVDQVPDQSTPNKRSRRGKNVANSSSARQAPSGSDPSGGPARNTRKRKQPPVTPAAPTLAASRPARTAAIRAREVIHDVATGRRSRSSTAEPKEEEKPELSVLPPTKRRKTNRDRSNTPDTKLPKVEELEKKSEQGSSVPALRKTTRTRRQTQTFPPQPPPTATPRRATRSAGMITTTDTGSGSSIQVETTPPEDVIMTTETGTGNSMKVETALLKAVITTTETESGSSVQVKTTPLEDMNQKPVSPTQCEERPNSPSPHRLVEVRTPPSPAQHKEVQLKSPSATLQKEGEQKSSSIQHVEEVPKSPSSPQQEEEKQKSPSLALQAEGIQKSPSPILQVAEIPKPSSPIQQEKVHQRSPPPKPASPTQQLLQEANVPRTGQPTTRRRLTRDQEHDMLLREADESLSSYLAEDMPKSGRVIDELGSHVALVKDLTVNESTTIIGPQKERSEKPGSPEILTRNPIADETTGPQSEHSKKPGLPPVPAGGPIADETVTRIDSQAERSPFPSSPSTSASSERSVAITLRLSLDALRDFSRAASPVEPDISGEVVALIEEPDALEAAKNLVDISNKLLVASPPPARPPTAVELGPNCALCSRTLGEIKAIRESEGLLPVSDDVILAEHVELCLAYTGADADFGDDDYSPPESVPELGLEDDTEVESIEVLENYGKDGHPTRVLPYYIRDVLNTGNATLFPPLPSLDEFRQLLADPELTPEQHMAVEEALVFSMHTTQEEWHLLEQLACTKGAAAPRRARKGAKIPPRRREPFKPEDPAVYEEQKEAALYSYDNSSSKYSMRREGLRTRQKHLDPIVVPGYEYTPGVPQTMEPKLTRGRNKNEASSVRATTTPAPAHVTVSSKVPGPATAANSGRSTPAVVTGDQPVKRGPGRPRKDGLAPGSRPQAAATSAAATSSTSAPTSAQVSQSVFKISFGKQGRESMKGILSRDVSPGTSHPSTPADGPPSTANGDSIKQPADERSKVGVPRGTVAATGTGRKRGRPKKADVAALAGPPRLQLNIPTIGSSQFSSFPIANEAHGPGVSRRGSTASDNDTQRPVRGKTYKTPTSIEAPLPRPTMEEEFKAAASSNLGPRVRKRRLDDGDLTEAPTAKKSRRNEVASTSAG